MDGPAATGLAQSVPARGVRITIRHVARAAGVSTATVSNVLNGRETVAPELTARVKAAMAELGYRRDRVAASLRSRQSLVVGVVMPTLASPFIAALANHLESLADADGFQLLIGSANEDAQQELARVQTMLSWRVAGLILAPVDGSTAASLPGRHEVETVIVDRTSAMLQVDSVGVNNHEAALSATRRLIALGHRTILAVGTRESVPNMQARFEGFRAAVRKAGLGRECAVLAGGGDLAAIGGALAARLGQGRLPSAIFALSDVATLAAVQAVSERGLQMPEQISLLGFDDHEWMQVLRPPISAVRQPTLELARQAWARLRRRLGGDAAPPQQIHLACTIEWRGSTAPPVGG